MDLGLKGRVVIVTGGASNLGRAISLGFAEEGARVLIADIDLEQATRVEAEARARHARDLGPRVDVGVGPGAIVQPRGPRKGGPRLSPAPPRNSGGRCAGGSAAGIGPSVLHHRPDAVGQRRLQHDLIEDLTSTLSPAIDSIAAGKRKDERVDPRSPKGSQPLSALGRRTNDRESTREIV